MKKFQTVVIGSGPGGYVAAIRCSQLGYTTAIIEKYPTLGGTCLNVGCIPTKALLDSSEHFHKANHQFMEHGIEITNLQVNFEQMLKRKNTVVSQTAEGIKFLMKKNKIEVFQGKGSFIDKNNLLISGDKEEKIYAEKIIIATGSKPSTIPGVEINKKRIISSTEALSLGHIPKTMVIIGGGVIGLEIGSVFARLGTTITVVEYFDEIIATMDRALGKELRKILTKELGFHFNLGLQVTSANEKGEMVYVKAKSKDGVETEIVAEYCLVAVGRKPYTVDLKLENAGIKPDEKGRIPVNENLETTTPGIFAIGDVVRGAMLAHKAEEEGVFVAEKIAGQNPHINYRLIPGVVYTWPEVAGTGSTEEELKLNNASYKTGIFPFKALGRARAGMDIDGFVKVLTDKSSDEILGVHIIGARAADLIGEAVTAMEFRASAEDIARISHAHPTYSEAFKEACYAAWAGKTLNM